MTRYGVERLTKTHAFFWGGFLSQWFGCDFSDEDRAYTSTEQYMMYHKAMAMGDIESANAIMKTDDPETQKFIGRHVSNYDDDLWDYARYNVVVEGNWLKFSQNPDLAEGLFDLGDRILVEASPEDRIWGIGLAPQDPLVLDETKWDGKNLLGKAIMEVRDELRSC